MSAVQFLSSTLGRQAKVAALTTVVPAMLGLWVWSRYRARGEWYAHYGSGGAILLATGLAAAGTFLAVASALDPQRRKRPLRWAVPAAIVLVSALFVGFRWFFPRPSLEGAQAAYEIRDLDRVRAELDALEARDPDTPGMAELRARLPRSNPEQERTADDHRLSEVSDVSLKTGTNLVLRRTWDDPEKQETARRRLLQRARAIADDEWERGDGPALARILEHTRGLDEEFTTQTTHRAALAYARACLDQQRLSCVREALSKLEDEPLEPSLQAIRETIESELEEPSDAAH